MPVSDEKIRTALEMMPISVLRTMIEERELGVTSRGSAELIDALLDSGWTNDEYEELKQRLGDVKREQSPYGRYIVELESINQSVASDATTHERVNTILQTNACSFDETGLTEPGFEIDQVNESSVTGIHWTKSTNYKLSPLNEIKTEDTLYDTGFEFDFKSGILLINCSLPAKARSLTKTLHNLGIDTSDVGHNNLSSERANQAVQAFIDDLTDKLLDQNDQSSLGPTDTPSVLEVDLVELLIDESELEDVQLGGRTNIIDNETVEEFRENHDSRVVKIEGQFRLNGTYYDFTSGYTDGMGQVSVKKKGRVEERPELVEEAFDFFYESYHQFFVDV